MKTCREIVEVLIDYLEGRLSSAERAEVDAHFADCPPCVAFVRSYKETPRLLRDATAAKLPPEVADRLSKFLSERRKKKS